MKILNEKSGRELNFVILIVMICKSRTTNKTVTVTRSRYNWKNSKTMDHDSINLLLAVRNLLAIIIGILHTFGVKKGWGGRGGFYFTPDPND